MNLTIGLSFFLLEVVFILLACLSILRTGFARLSSSIGIARDGIPRGRSAPAWSLPDLEGHLRATPAGDHWQFLIFANRALVAFPDLVDGMHRFAREIQEVEVLVLSHEPHEDCLVTQQGMDLQVPLLAVDPAFYDRFRVRVVPFAMLLDPDGVVRWVGLVNTGAQLFHAWRMAQVPLASRSSVEVA